MSQASRFSHSADVQAWLEGDFGRVAVDRIRPKSIVVKATHDIAPCQANLIVVVDGEKSGRLIQIVSGFLNGRRTSLIRAALPDPPF